MQMSKGDILGHEFCGIVDKVGPSVKGIEVGKRYVVSFQIACGDVGTLFSVSRRFFADRLVPVFLLQTKAVVPVRDDQLQHHDQGHVRR